VESDQKYGIFMYSADGGNTWLKPSIVTHPNSNNEQLTVGADGKGGVMLVWRTLSPEFPGIYYIWSTDWGKSWSPPKTLPNIVARVWSGRFDKYDMATDSAGRIHLMVAGNLPTKLESPPGLYHLEWDGHNWSAPGPVYEGTWYPEYPQLVIHRGNQLHAAWFLREDPYEATKTNQVWYAQGQSQAPAQVPTPRPTPTVMPTSTATPTVLPTPTSKPPTPTPTLDPDLSHVSVPPGATESIYTDMDDVLLLATSLIPAGLIIIIVVVSVRFLRR
jgi:hypothetical protein